MCMHAYALLKKLVALRILSAERCLAVIASLLRRYIWNQSASELRKTGSIDQGDPFCYGTSLCYSVLVTRFTVPEIVTDFADCLRWVFQADQRVLWQCDRTRHVRSTGHEEI